MAKDEKAEVKVTEKTPEKVDTEAFIARKLRSLNKKPDSHLRDYLASRVLNNRRG